MSRLPSVRRTDAPHEKDPRKLTEQQKKCARAVVRRWCQDRAAEEEQRLLAALGIEEP